MPDDGLVSLAEAFESAESDASSADLAVEATTQPVVDSDDTSASNTPEAQTVDTPDNEQGIEGLDLAGLEELVTGDSDSSPIDVTSQEFLDTIVTVDTVTGPESVTVQELQKGFLRQADYTRKTQELADQRRAATEAVEFYETFRKDPQEFARAIAVRAGFIEEGAEPIKQIEVAKIPTAESIEELVEQRVQERLSSDPAIRDAKLAAARQAVSETFASIEAKYNTTLTKDQREAVIKEANKVGSTNLPLVFEAMVGRLRSQQSRRPTSSGRPKSSASGEQPAQPKIPDSVREAFEMSEADLAGS